MNTQDQDPAVSDSQGEMTMSEFVELSMNHYFLMNQTDEDLLSDSYPNWDMTLISAARKEHQANGQSEWFTEMHDRLFNLAVKLISMNRAPDGNRILTALLAIR